MKLSVLLLPAPSFFLPSSCKFLHFLCRVLLFTSFSVFMLIGNKRSIAHEKFILGIGNDVIHKPVRDVYQSTEKYQWTD